MRLFESVLVASIVAVSVAQPVAAQRPLSMPGPFRESVAIHVDSKTARSIETAREHLLQRQWSEAIPILQQIIESRESSLIPAEPGRYLNSTDYCHLLISLLPDEGLATYREQIDPRFRERFTKARDTFDEAELSTIVRSAFNCSFADETLLLLADLKFERGEYAAAREHLELLVPSSGQFPEEADQESGDDQSQSLEDTFLTFRDSDIPIEQILARLVLCSIFEGDKQRAVSEFSQFGFRYRDADGHLAGRDGPLTQTLRAVLTESSTWKLATAQEETTSLERHSRNPLPAPTLRPSRILWRQPVPQFSFRGPKVRSLLNHDQPLALHPIVVDGNVFVANADAVFAFELDSGRPAWPGSEPDDAVIFRSSDVQNSLHRPSTGVPSFPLCASAGRLFVRRGTPLLRKSPYETRAVSEIVALDVAQREGQLNLRVTSNQVEPKMNPTQAAAMQFAKSPEATTWSFEGTPVVSEDRLFVSLRQGAPEDRTAVACFDNRTGRLIWKRNVTANLTRLPDHFNLVGTNLLTHDNGRLFLATGTGAIAALDAESGRILWIVTYESHDYDTPESFSDPRRNGLTPCLSAHGIVFAAPLDSDLLFALEATTGRLVWTRRLPRQAQHLIGVSNGRLFVARDSLQAFNLLTGAPAWSRPVSFTDHAGQVFGRPVLTKDRIIWPLHDELLYVDQLSGAVADRINLGQAFGIAAGNLSIHQNRMIIAQSDSLVVLEGELLDYAE